MSEACKLLLDRIERDPETQHIAPIIRAILGLPRSKVSIYLALNSFWATLPCDRRAMLVVALMEQEGMTLGKVASYCGINRRTLYKSERFQKVLQKLRGKPRPDSQDPSPSDGEGDEDSDRWEDD
ncbi:hypothetical protein BH23PLA1_BH23PLA1_30340 [soil metagenome]